MPEKKKPGGWTFPGYIAFYTVVLNFVVSGVITPVFNVLGAGQRRDQTDAFVDYAG